MNSLSDEEYEGGDDKLLGEKEWLKIRNHRLTNGYKEGYSAGEEEMLQQGFDEGYTMSVNVAFQIAKMRGNLCALLCKKETNVSDYPSSTEDAQDLVTRLSAVEESLAKARTDPKISEILGARGDLGGCSTSCDCKNSSSDTEDKTECADAVKNCCKGDSSCGSGGGDKGKGSSDELKNHIEGELRTLRNVYMEELLKWNKTEPK